MPKDLLEKYREYIREMENDLSELQAEFWVMEKDMEEIKVIIMREKAIEASMNRVIAAPKEGLPWTAVCEGLLAAEYKRLEEIKVRYDGLVKKKEMLVELIRECEKNLATEVSPRDNPKSPIGR